MKVLITGGAGFIGTHLSRKLVELGHSVRVLDNLTPQVHGSDTDIQKIVESGIDFMLGDVRDLDTVRRAVREVEVVFHLAAQTGVGQSMYQMKDYMDCNVVGTAQLLDVLAGDKQNIRCLILASSRAVYGEGKYSCSQCGVVYPPPRTQEQLRKADWEVHCPNCSATLECLPTDEDKPLQPGSVYAISKRAQEELCLCVGRAYKIPVKILRFFNVYGSGQSLTNPYTGIMTIFASKIKKAEPPLIYEDGLESRDFVHVKDVVNALVLAMENGRTNYEVVNVGSGRALSVFEMAKIMIRLKGVDLEPRIIRKYRVGDIRHCYADLTKAREIFRYEPTVSFEEGIIEFLDWAGDRPSEDRLAAATAELEQHGLYR